MKSENLSRRGFMKAVGGAAGGLAAAIAVPGCSAIRQRSEEIARDGSRSLKSLGTRLNPPAYVTNASNTLSATKFGDKYFNSRNSVFNINGTEYVCMPLANHNVEVEGKTLAEADYLPFAAFKRKEMLVKINSETRQINYGYEDGTAIVFVKDPSVKTIPTGFKATMDSIGNKRVAHTSEPKFNIPLINFGLQGYNSVAYAEDVNNDKQLILLPNPNYGINWERGGIVQYFPANGAYIAEIGKLTVKPTPQPVKPAAQPKPLEVTVERVKLPATK